MSSSSEHDVPSAPVRAVPQFKSFAPTPKPVTATSLTVHGSSNISIKKSPYSDDSKSRDREHRLKDRKERGKPDHHRLSSSKTDELKTSRRHHSTTDHDRQHSRRHRSRSPRHRSRDSRSRSRSPPAKKNRNNVADATVLAWDTPDLPYQIDTKGDQHNLTYGTIHRYSVPTYRRIGTRIVGLDTNLRIDRERDEGKGIVVDAGHAGKGSAGRSGYVFATDDTKLLRVKKPGDGVINKELEENQDYVRISSQPRKRRHNHEGSEIGPQPVDYRSIHGPETEGANELPDSDLEVESSSDDEAPAFDAVTREKTIRLARLTVAEPYNIDTWLELVDHQETVLLGHEEGRRRRKVKQGEKQSLEEVKLSVLEKALEKNRGDERLLSRYMNTGTRIWDSVKLKMKWKEVLRSNSGSIEIWKLYLTYMMTDFANFKFQDCVKAFESCLQMLRNVIFFSILSDQKKVEVEKVVVYVFLRATLFFKEAGFSEIAIAAWQCLAELNTSLPKIFEPPTSLTSHNAVLKCLSTFWESEVYRIGELGAKGFDVYATEDIGDFPSPKNLASDQTEKKELDINDSDFFGTWFDREMELRGKPPARTTDEVEEDDPYRVILFRDVEEFMYCFQTAEAREQMAYAFLAFSGVVMNGEYALDSFVRNDLASGDAELGNWFWPASQEKKAKMITWLDGAAMEPERKSGLADSPFSFRSTNVPISADTLFPALGGWFSAIEVTKQNAPALQFTSQFLKELVTRQNDEKLALVLLAFETGRSPSTVKKMAKQLLKIFSTSLPLYNAYALIEWRDGNLIAARNVFSVALGMSASLSEKEIFDSVLLWRTWAWEEIFSGNRSKAICVLLCIPNGIYKEAENDEYSRTALLKTRKYVEERQYHLLANGDYATAAMYNEARALLEYLLSKASDLTEAFDVLAQLDDELHRRKLADSTLYEAFLMTKSRFCYIHAISSKLVKVATLREVFSQGVQRFPHNTAFLSLYAWNEGRTRIENRVRTTLQDVVLVEGRETVVGWVFAVWAELQMGVGRRLNDAAVRGLFERAIECGQTSSSIELWMLYVEFELRQVEPRRAKEVLYRAIRACPWAKDITLTAFMKLRSIMDFTELRKVYALMVEKEIRVHVEIEELLEDWDEKYGRLSSKGSGGGSGPLRPRIVLPDDEDSGGEMGD